MKSELATIAAEQFVKIVANLTPIIDVRAPVEFAQGHIPGAINLPILNDQDRHEIGTIYKNQGQDAAVKRGHELVSGEVKAQRVQAWVDQVRQNPETILTCFRGGMRSQISQQWLADQGIHRPRIAGGYKAFRQFLIDEIERLSKRKMMVVSGATGSGKSLVIQEIQKFRPTVDLEKLANHRGSAFGSYLIPQPSQADFENRLAYELIHLDLDVDSKNYKQNLVVEDESRMIGRSVQPESFFNHLRDSEIVLVEETIESRVQVTFDDYIAAVLPADRVLVFANYEKSLQNISKKLGGLRHQEVLQDLRSAVSASVDHGDLSGHKVWIEKVLVWYYDPLYFNSLEKRQPQVLFKGPRKAVLEFLKG